MIYDYRPKKVADDLEEIFDSLNGQQMEKVCEFLSHMRDEEEYRKGFMPDRCGSRDATLVFLYEKLCGKDLFQTGDQRKRYRFLCGPAK